MARQTLADAAWERLLAAKGIDLATAKLPVTLPTADLEKAGGRQARLMISMDERDKWPSVLRRHGVFPLSVSRKEVALVKGEPFHDFPPVPTPRADYEARLPIRFVSHMLGQGENAHVTRLHTAGFLEKFLGGSALHFVTSGKRHSPAFTVEIGEQALRLKGVQYEMDAQYESAEGLVPIEMKTSPYPTCAVKQVYLPYRSLGEDTGWAKPVRPVYATCSEAEDEYVVRELAFARPDAWDSIRVVKAEAVRLKLKDPPPKLLDLDVQLLASNRVPQADAPQRIQDLPAAVARGVTNAKLLADHHRFDERQSSYYRDAAEMLGLLATEGGKYVLTPDGRRFAERPRQKQADDLAARMCRLPAVNAALVEMERRGDAGLALDEVEGIVQRHAEATREPASGTTIRRRAQTIRAWLRFIGSRTGAIVAVGDRLYLRGEVPRLDDFDVTGEPKPRSSPPPRGRGP